MRHSRLQTLVLAAAAIVLSAPCVACLATAQAVSTAAAKSASAAAVQSASVPPPSGLPGYWAETSCSEGEETANTEGWQAGTTGGYPSGYFSINTCSDLHGSLLLRDEGTLDTQADSGPTYIYKAPANSTIAGGVLEVSATTFPEGYADITSTPGSSTIYTCTGCQHSPIEPSPLPESTSGSTGLLASAICLRPEGKACSNHNTNAELAITSATIVLHHESTPTGSGFGGSLLEDPTSGNANLAFTAQEENGPGVYRVSALLDGQVLWAATPNLNDGECVAYGSYHGALNFRWRQPCPQETAANIEIPTASIANGQHQLKVEVEDAAGNTSVVYEHAITIANDPAAVLGVTAPVRGPANGTPASESAILTAQWKGKSGKSGKESANRLTSAYGRSHVVTGKLTNTSGTPIVDALIEANQKPSSLGAIASSLASTHTATDGSFMIHVPSGASSSIQLVYRSHLGDAQPAATQTLTLQVPASIHLEVSPHVTSVGRTIILSGKLAGPIPPGGKQVLFEAHAVGGGGSWIEFHNATVDAHGHFRATHRFTFPGPAHYQFRVVCVREADFPFLTGISNVVHVRER